MKCLSERKKKKMLREIILRLRLKPVKKTISFPKLNVSGLSLKKEFAFIPNCYQHVYRELFAKSK